MSEFVLLALLIGSLFAGALIVAAAMRSSQITDATEGVDREETEGAERHEQKLKRPYPSRVEKPEQAAWFFSAGDSSSPPVDSSHHDHC